MGWRELCAAFGHFGVPFSASVHEHGSVFRYPVLGRRGLEYNCATEIFK